MVTHVLLREQTISQDKAIQSGQNQLLKILKIIFETKLLIFFFLIKIYYENG